MSLDRTTGISWVGVDWGTTHRRLYGIDAQGGLLNTTSDADGAMACKGRFPESLQIGLGHLEARSAQTVMLSGMVGSTLGWRSVPYVDATVNLLDLHRHIHTIEDTHRTGPVTAIVPGYCVRDSQGNPDVMRGEETQLLGAVLQGYQSGWFVLPGTHSKWVQIDQGRIVQLRTYMTGELFDTLSRQGTLATLSGTEHHTWDDAAFAQGIQAGRDGMLSHALFTCRARVVSGDMPGVAVRSYLSGLLISAEIHNVVRHGLQADNGIAFAIGSAELGMRYAQVAQRIGLQLRVLDAQAAFIAAQAHFQANWPSR